MTRLFRLLSAPALGLATLAGLGLTPAPAHAQMTNYSSPTAFNSTFPSLPVETFESAVVGSGQVVTMPSPLDENTNNAVFATGSILDGLRITDTGPGAADPRALVVAGAGFNGYASKAIYVNSALDGLTLSFTDSGGVRDVGLDLLNYGGSAQQTVTAFNGTTDLGTWTPTVDGNGTFFGLSSGGSLITSLTITGDGNHQRGVDNVAFGNPPAAVPESPSAVGLGVGLLAFSALALSRRRKASAPA